MTFRRRTPLRAKTPLRRFTELRRTALPRVPTPTEASGGLSPAGEVSPPSVVPRPRVRPKRSHRLPVDVSAIVVERSGELCEAGLEGCWRFAREKHHRISQKLGGRHRSARRRSDRASNLLHLCVFCHHLVTLDPEMAYEHGLSLREKQEPTSEYVLYRGEAVYLDDLGGVHDYETAGA